MVRFVRPALVAAIALYGALLRLGAISQSFDPVSAPRWLYRIEASRAAASRLRPASLHWDAFPRFDHKGRHHVVERRLESQRPTILVPLPQPLDYDALLRIDAPSLDPLMNGRVVARCDPDSRPGRIGICRFQLGRDVTRAGTNRLTLALDSRATARSGTFDCSRADRLTAWFRAATGSESEASACPSRLRS